MAGVAGGSKWWLGWQVRAWHGWRRHLVQAAWQGTARCRRASAHRRPTPLSVQRASRGGQGHKAARRILDVGLPAQQQHRALRAHTRRQRWSAGGGRGRRGQQALRQVLHGKGGWRSWLHQALLLQEGMRGGGGVGGPHRRGRRSEGCSMRRWRGVGAESCIKGALRLHARRERGQGLVLLLRQRLLLLHHRLLLEPELLLVLLLLLLLHGLLRSCVVLRRRRLVARRRQVLLGHRLRHRLPHRLPQVAEVS